MKLSKYMFFLLLAVILSTGSCTNNALDDGDGPDVVMLIEEVTNDPITASLDLATGICTFTVNEWEVTVRNEPLNGFAGEGAFNDIIVMNAVLEYDWEATSLVLPTHYTVGLGDVAIPTGGTNKFSFYPIYLQDFEEDDFTGNTANVTITITAITVEGTTITKTFGVQLMIESCA